MSSAQWILVSMVGVGMAFSLLNTGKVTAIEDSFKTVDPNVIRFCVNQLLYDHTFSDGTPAGKRTIIDPSSAALACRGVTSKQDARAQKKCVNGLLYDETFSDGKPVGDRTIIDPASAARACALCSDHS